MTDKLRIASFTVQPDFMAGLLNFGNEYRICDAEWDQRYQVIRFYIEGVHLPEHSPGCPVQDVDPWALLGAQVPDKLSADSHRLLILATKHCPTDHNDWKEICGIAARGSDQWIKKYK